LLGCTLLVTGHPIDAQIPDHPLASVLAHIQSSLLFLGVLDSALLMTPPSPRAPVRLFHEGVRAFHSRSEPSAMRLSSGDHAIQKLIDGPNVKRDGTGHWRDEGANLDICTRRLIPGRLDRSVRAEIVPGTSVPLVARTGAAFPRAAVLSLAEQVGSTARPVLCLAYLVVARVPLVRREDAVLLPVVKRRVHRVLVAGALSEARRAELGTHAD
jgi:hypothetical protein